MNARRESNILQPVVPFVLPGLRVSIKRFTPGQKLAWCRPIPGRLCVMMAGEMLEAERAREVRYRPADLVYKPPEERPHLTFGAEGARTVTVELETDRLAWLAEAGLPLDRSFQRASAVAAVLGARVAYELQYQDELTPLAVAGLTLELLAEACRLARPTRGVRGPRWLCQVNERVRAEFTRRLTLADCAREAGVHPVHLAQSFRAQYAESFGQCIRRLRIDLASRLLAGTQCSLVEVALETGFADQSHFTKAFRRASGMTPARFRRAFRPSQEP